MRAQKSNCCRDLCKAIARNEGKNGIFEGPKNVEVTLNNDSAQIVEMVVSCFGGAQLESGWRLEAHPCNNVIAGGWWIAEHNGRSGKA